MRAGCAANEAFLLSIPPETDNASAAHPGYDEQRISPPDETPLWVILAPLCVLNVLPTRVEERNVAAPQLELRCEPIRTAIVFRALASGINERETAMPHRPWPSHSGRTLR